MKKLLVYWLILTMTFAPAISMAQVSAVLPMQRAVAVLIKEKALARGFAANDPRIAATLQAGGTALAGAASAAALVTAAGVTAPAWVTAAAVLGLGVLFAEGISLAIDGVKWIFNADGTVTYGGVTGPSTDPSARWQPVNGASCIQTNVANNCSQSDGTMIPMCLGEPHINPTNACLPGWAGYGFSRQATGKEDAMGVAGYALPVVTTPGETVTVSQAVAALSDADKAQPLNPAVLAAVADLVWQEAASRPGYAGVPYDAANPITPADATAYQVANPDGYPTVGSSSSPQSGGSADTGSGPQTSPFALSQAAASSPGGEEPPIEEPSKIDWSVVPSADVVPKQAVPVSYTPTIFAAPTGCPAPVTFSMFGKPHAISYQPACDLMVTVAPIFLACGAAAAALIFASALRS